MGVRGEREGLLGMLAISFAEVAGVAGRQSGVLSSSARVSHVTASSQFSGMSHVLTVENIGHVVEWMACRTLLVPSPGCSAQSE